MHAFDTLLTDSWLRTFHPPTYRQRPITFLYLRRPVGCYTMPTPQNSSPLWRLPNWREIFKLREIQHLRENVEKISFFIVHLMLSRCLCRLKPHPLPEKPYKRGVNCYWEGTLCMKIWENGKCTHPCSLPQFTKLLSESLTPPHTSHTHHAHTHTHTHTHTSHLTHTQWLSERTHELSTAVTIQRVVVRRHHSGGGTKERGVVPLLTIPLSVGQPCKCTYM